MYYHFRLTYGRFELIERNNPVRMFENDSDSLSRHRPLPVFDFYP